MIVLNIPDIARKQAALICERIPHLEVAEGKIPATLDQTYGMGGWTISFRHQTVGQLCAITQYERSGILLLVLFRSELTNSLQHKLRELAYPIATATNKQLLTQEIDAR
jgi:hypothetical protein